MKYSLISDLHLDLGGWNWKHDTLEDIIIVAGDTTNGLAGLKFLNKLQKVGHIVIACDGNHEHYSNLSQGRSIEETADRFHQDYDNKILWMAAEDRHQDIAFIQANGWYYVRDEGQWRDYMNDYLCGRANDINKAADDDVFFLWNQLTHYRQVKTKVIVTTHTAPSLDTLDRKFEGHTSNNWYYNPRMGELRKEFQDIILVWNHGHTHAPADMIIDGVRTVCNPRGYPGENPNWKPVTIEVN